MPTLGQADNPTVPQDRNDRPLAILAVLALVGTAGFALLSFWIPLLDRSGNQFLLRASDDGRDLAELPTWLVAATVAAAATGGLGLLLALWRDQRISSALAWCGRWFGANPWLGVALVLVVAAGAVDVYELVYDPYQGRSGLRVWMLREDLQMWLSLGAAILGALAISAMSPGPKPLGRLIQWADTSVRLQAPRWWAVAAITPALLGGMMCVVALDGIPHFSDALTYLIQGRMLYNGGLWMPTPAHHQLFQDSLFFVETNGRYFGKYPIGWPALLGAFDGIGIGTMANAVMTGLTALLTGLIALQFATARVAVLAALLYGLSPWAWFNGANFSAHGSTTCAIMAFMWLFLRTLRTGHIASACGAGLALGAAVLIRPFDAAVFALPAVFVVLTCQVRRPKRWIGLGAVIAAGALAGVGVYLWVNAQTTGHALLSPYSLEPRWKTDWQQSVSSVLGRLAFQFSELNSRCPGWGIGGLTVAVMGAIAAGQRWRCGGLRLLTVSTVLYFVACTTFGFTNVWWGPRWLAPVTPLLAILAAELLDRIMSQLLPPLVGQIKDQGASAAAQLAVCLLLSGLVVAVAGRYAGQFYHHRLAPPHLVSGRLHQTVTNQGITGVVAMPPTGSRAPLDARAGMAFMTMPIENNPVIYVRAIPNWPVLASEAYPDRPLYEVFPNTDDANGFVVKPVNLQ